MRTWGYRFGWMAVGVAALYVVSALAGVARGGPLDPPGPPVSSMQTIDSIPPSWFRILRTGGGQDPCASERFVCVLNGDGVLDHETGLVWRTMPDRTDVQWATASAGCVVLGLSGGVPVLNRYGWRLPSADELLTLLVTGVFQGLPAEHPFTNADLSGQEYWTSTDQPGNAANAFTIGDYASGSAWHLRDKVTSTADQWCVRGPAGGG